MSHREDIDLFISKVPALKNPLNVVLTILYILALSVGCFVYFYLLNPLAVWMPVVTQFVMALVVVWISWRHLSRAEAYRKQYGDLAYQPYFYRLMIPYLVTWYAVFFHPLGVRGTALLPMELAIGLGVSLMVVMVLTSIRLEQSGFRLTLGMDVYTMFPEETPVIHGQIYAFIRHPLYFSLMVGSLALALFQNNLRAFIVALIGAIPAVVVGMMEDQELVGRYGDQHREYIQQTPALIPLRRFGAFLKFMFGI